MTTLVTAFADGLLTMSLILSGALLGWALGKAGSPHEYAAVRFMIRARQNLILASLVIWPPTPRPAH